MSHVSVFAPASVANISCGFDVLGVCLDNVGDTIHVQETSKPGIEITKIMAIERCFGLTLELNFPLKNRAKK